MIHIVTHCYAGLLPQYAVHLNYQLSSLATYAVSVPIAVTVCRSPDDELTASVVNWFRANTRLHINSQVLDKGHLFRRSIGRDMGSRALSIMRGWTWFTDVDHVFGEGCLDSVWSEVNKNKDAVLLWPKTIQIQAEHSLGDCLIEDMTIGFRQIDPSQFVTKRNSRAIGGIQIVPNWYLQEHGYLRDFMRYQTPTDGSKPFPDFKDDVAFRAECSATGRVTSINATGLYRIRHSKTTYQGQCHVAPNTKLDQSIPKSV